MSNRVLRTISINFPFVSKAVVQETDLTTPKAFFDFDVLVIRPYPLRRLRTSSDFGVYFGLKDEMERKIGEIFRLFDRGGLVVVILDSVDKLTVRTGGHFGGEVHTVTNYDFLGKRFFLSVRNGHGNRIESLDLAEPFSRVIKNSSVEWTAYLVDKPEEFHDLKFFAQSGAHAFVGASVNLGEGHLVFLPNMKKVDEGEFFRACIDYRYEREGTPKPEWLREVFLPTLADADAAVAKAEERIVTLAQERDDLARNRTSLLEYQKLLYEKGKAQLEPIVRRSLDLLGFATTPGEVISGTNYEIDGRTAQGSTPGILEIKGSKKQIVLDEFAPFVTKLLADLRSTGIQSKGILIGNGLCELPPAKRLGSATFSAHVKDAASQHSIALVSSVELYCIVCALLGKEEVDAKAIREAVLTTKGYVDLGRFCSELPFKK